MRLLTALPSSLLLCSCFLLLIGQLSSSLADAVTLDELPKHLQLIGMQLFKDRDTFDAILKLVHPPIHLSVLGTNMLIATLSPDEGSRNRTQREFGELKQPGGSIITLSGNATMSIMIDIGANFGVISIYFALKYPGLKIIAVEAAPPTYFLLCYNMHLNKIAHLHMGDVTHRIGGITSSSTHARQRGGILALNRVVASSTDAKEIEFTYYVSDSQLSGLSDAAASKDIRKSMVKPLNIVSLFERIDVISHPIAYFKIDCEGCEFDVLPGISTYFTDRTKLQRVGGEFHISLMEQQKGTFVRGFTKAQIDATVATMKARKCALEWSFQC